MPNWKNEFWGVIFGNLANRITVHWEFRDVIYSEGKRMSHPWPFIGVKWLFSRGRRARKKYFHGLELELFQSALIRPLK